MQVCILYILSIRKKERKNCIYRGCPQKEGGGGIPPSAKDTSLFANVIKSCRSSDRKIYEISFLPLQVEKVGGRGSWPYPRELLTCSPNLMQMCIVYMSRIFDVAWHTLIDRRRTRNGSRHLLNQLLDNLIDYTSIQILYRGLRGHDVQT